MDWSKLPDLIGVGLLAWAFVSVARRNHTPISRHWLTGWMLIVLHFAGLMLAGLPGLTGEFGGIVSVLALALAAVLFIRASVPYRSEHTSKMMFYTLLSVLGLYLSALLLAAGPRTLVFAAILLGTAPLAIAVWAFPRFIHPLRWVTVLLHLALGCVLIIVQSRPGGVDLAIDATLFFVYLNCSIHFWYMYRGATSGAMISITGFFLWSSVFVVAPAWAAHFPNVHLENEVWNLPKYVVAVGMILLLLEEQIAHSKHLALHDELTGLPNRRLFQDRLAGALERARRIQNKTALLMIDLDQFKRVNDTMGHHAGDELLARVGRILAERIRRSDTIARTGGDEFAVVLEAPTTLLEAEDVAQNLLDLLKKPIEVEGCTVQVGASLGVAVYPDDAEDLERLCIVADSRMYENKRTTAQRSDAVRSCSTPSRKSLTPPHRESELGMAQ